MRLPSFLEDIAASLGVESILVAAPQKADEPFPTLLARVKEQQTAILYQTDSGSYLAARFPANSDQLLVLKRDTPFDDLHRLLIAQAISEHQGVSDATISQLSVADKPFGTVITEMLKHLTHLFGVDAATITLWDARDQVYRRLAAYGVEDYLARNTMPQSSLSLTQQLVRDKNIIILNDAQNQPEPASILITDYKVRALAGVPILARGRAIGALFLLAIDTPAQFSQATLQRHQALFDLIALFLAHHAIHKDNQQQVEQTSALLEIAEIAASSSELDQLLQRVLELCRQVLDVEAAGILLYNEEKQALEYPHNSGAFGFRKNLRNVSFPIREDNILTQVFQSGQPHFIPDTSTLHGSLHAIVEALAFQNALVVPVRVHDYPLGVFVVAGKTDGFNYSDAALLVAMSSHIASALRSSQLLQNTRARLQESEIMQRVAAITSATLELDDLLSVVTIETAHVFEAAAAHFYLLKGQELVLHEPSKIGELDNWAITRVNMDDMEHPFVKVIFDGMPVLSNEPSTLPDMPYESLMALPLNTQQGTIGVLALINNASNDFTYAQGTIALTLANQVATSVQSIILLEEESERADLMLLIARIAQDISATLDLRGLMRKVIDNIHQTLGYDSVFVFLLDERQENLVCQASAATNPDHTKPYGFSVPITEGILGKAAREKRAFLTQDVTEDSDYVLTEGHAAFQSAITVPLQYGETTYGAMQILGLEKNAFTQTDLTAVENLASQVSIGVDNARLYQQAQRRLLEQSIVHQIGQDLNSILDYNELVNALVRHMTRALDTSSCSVALYDRIRQRIHIDADYQLADNETLSNHLQVGMSYSLDKRHAIREAILSRSVISTYRHMPGGNPLHQQQLAEENAFSELIIPMSIGERVIGVVRWVENRREREFVLDDERLALTLISQAAIAVENARLFREAERRATEQTLLNRLTLGLTKANRLDELIPIFAQQTLNALDIGYIAIAIQTEQRPLAIHTCLPLTTPPTDTILHRLLTNPPPRGHILSALRQGDAVFTTADFVTQTAGQVELLLMIGDNSSVALVPIMYREALVGIVEIYGDAGNNFDLNDIQLLEAFANQAAVAMDNVRLTESEQRRLRQMERIQATARLISSELVTQNVLDLVIEEAAALFHVPAVAVGIPDELGVFEIIQAARGLSDKYIRQHRVPIPDMANYIRTDDTQRRVHFISDLTTLDMSQIQHALVAEEGLKSALFVPLIKGTRKFGTLMLYSKTANDIFPDDEVEIAQLLASHIAVALDNADLFQALEARAEELAEANRLKSQFLANISHELRTPMNSILGFSDFMLQGSYGKLNEQQHFRLERINENGKNLLALIDDLLDIAKIDAGRMELDVRDVDLVDEIQKVLDGIQSQAEKKGIYLKFDSPAHVPTVKADLVRLRQIIINLVGNALKFTKDGGITVTAEVKDEVVLSPQPEQAAHRRVVWVSIKDTGIGISLEDQLIIFDEFRQVDGSTTREYSGTGLGLAICRRLIEMMEGRIWVDSEVGHGSTFTFVIPAVVN